MTDRTNINLFGLNNAAQNIAFMRNIDKGLKENEKYRAKDQKFF